MNDTSHFDERASTWDDDPTKRERARAVARAIVDRVDLQGAHVIEDGCGTGLLGFALLEVASPATITFIDPSAAMREQVARKIEALPPQRACVIAPHEEVGAGRDLVTSLMVLHHVDDPAGTIRRWTEWLDTGAHLAIADLHAEDGSFHGPDEEHVHHGFDPTEVAGWMRDAGLEPSAPVDVFTMEKDVDGETRHYPVWLMVGRKS